MIPKSSVPEPEQVAAFFTKHRTGLVTLVFTDLVDSSGLLRKLGDQAGTTFMQRRRQLMREVLHLFPEAEEIGTAGDSFLLDFTKPSDAVRFALQVQARLRFFSKECGLSVQERIGIHLGEVVIAENETQTKAKDLYGLQITTCARVMGLAQGGQTLLTRGVFDSARQVLKGEDLLGVGPLSWVSHGPYQLKGIEEAVEVSEVGETGHSPLWAPKTSEKARRVEAAEGEAVLGWRPAVGQFVPNTKWILEEKLGEGGFGEVWKARHPKLDEQRVFKFCFRADRVRSLKREVTLFRLLKERIGEHPNIVKLYDIYFDEPPFYLEEEYVGGRDLKSWCEGQGGIEKVPRNVRLEIVAQVADALQAAHDAGIIHRDVKPGNILVSGQKEAVHSPLSVKLTDFGIGQVLSAEYLAGVTKAGFTETLVGSKSSGTGTTMYLAPEIVAGMPATTRSDIYSLGVVLYQLLIGNLKHPVTTDWAKDIDDSLLRDDLQHCFAGKPEDRFAAAGQLGQNLRALPTRRSFLAEQQAELAAREKAAYRRGIVRTASLASMIVAILAVLALFTVNQSRKARVAASRAEAGEQRARQNLYAADMLLAAQALQGNNRGRAVQLLDRNRLIGRPDSRGWEWRYLWNQCRSEAVALTPAHSNRVADVAFSPEGDLLYSASEDGTIKVWNVATRSILSTRPQPFAVQAIALSPDGRWLIAGALNGQAIRWDTRNWSNEFLALPKGAIVDLLFSPTGDKLAVFHDFSIEVLHLKDLKPVATLAASGSNRRHGQRMAFSFDGERLAYPAPGGRVALSDLKPESVVRILPGSLNDINSIAFSPDNRFLAAGDWTPKIALWDLGSNSELESLTNHAAWISAVAFLPDSTRLISASADQTLKYWDTSDWHEVATRRGHLDEVNCLAISPRGDWIATGGKDGALNLWTTRPPSKQATRLEFGRGRGLLSLDGRTLLILGTNGSVARWDAVTLQPKGTNSTIPYASARVSVAMGLGVQRLAVAEPDRVVEIWDSISFERVAQLEGPLEPVYGLKFCMDDTLLAVLSSGSNLTVWDSKSGRLVTRIGPLPGSSVSSVDFSLDKTRLAVGFANGDLQVWSLVPTVLLQNLQGQRQSIEVDGMTFSPDGRLLASGAPDATLRLWNLANGSFVALPRALMAYFSVVYSPDGQRIAAAGPDSVVRIIDTITGEEVASLNRNTVYRDFAKRSSLLRRWERVAGLVGNILDPMARGIARRNRFGRKGPIRGDTSLRKGFGGHDM